MTIFEQPPKRDRQVNFQLSAEEKARLEAAAAEAGLSISEYLRQAVNEKAARDAKKKVEKSRKRS